MTYSFAPAINFTINQSVGKAKQISYTLWSVKHNIFFLQTVSEMRLECEHICTSATKCYNGRCPLCSAEIPMNWHCPLTSAEIPMD